MLFAEFHTVSCYLPHTKSGGKVMFLHLSVYGEGVLWCNFLLWTALPPLWTAPPPDSTTPFRGRSRIPRRRGRQPSRRGCQHTIFPNFPKNCMKMRKFWAVGARAPGAPPLDPQLSWIAPLPPNSIPPQQRAVCILHPTGMLSCLYIFWLHVKKEHL